MSKLVTYIKSHYAVAALGIIGILIGVATGFGIAHASIPDTAGVIHGCRNTTTTLLRIVDSASQNCDSSETSLNWDQDGVKGYGRILFSSGEYSLDSARSKNISNLYTVAVGEEDVSYYACFTLSTTPKSLSIASQDSGWAPPAGAFKDVGGCTDTSVGNLCDSHGSGANVGVSASVSTAHSFLITLS